MANWPIRPTPDRARSSSPRASTSSYTWPQGSAANRARSSHPQGKGRVKGSSKAPTKADSKVQPNLRHTDWSIERYQQSLGQPGHDPAPTNPRAPSTPTVHNIDSSNSTQQFASCFNILDNDEVGDHRSMATKQLQDNEAAERRVGKFSKADTALALRAHSALDNRYDFSHQNPFRETGHFGQICGGTREGEATDGPKLPCHPATPLPSAISGTRPTRPCPLATDTATAGTSNHASPPLPPAGIPAFYTNHKAGGTKYAATCGSYLIWEENVHGELTHWVLLHTRGRRASDGKGRFASNGGCVQVQSKEKQ